jgi:quercetin dioxygenase-like cupin family protein
MPAESSGHSYLQKNQVSGEVLLLDVAGEVDAVLAAARGATNGQSAKTLVKEGPLRILILGLKQGASLHEHDASGPVSIHSLAGTAVISAGGIDHVIEAGKALVFAAAVRHGVEAKTECALLVTIAHVEGDR